MVLGAHSWAPAPSELQLTNFKTGGPRKPFPSYNWQNAVPRHRFAFSLTTDWRLQRAAMRMAAVHTGGLGYGSHP